MLGEGTTVDYEDSKLMTEMKMTKDANQCLSGDKIQWYIVLPQYTEEYWLSLIGVSEQNAMSKVTYIINIHFSQI